MGAAGSGSILDNADWAFWRQGPQSTANRDLPPITHAFARIGPATRRDKYMRCQRALRPRTGFPPVGTSKRTMTGACIVMTEGSVELRLRHGAFSLDAPHDASSMSADSIAGGRRR